MMLSFIRFLLWDILIPRITTEDWVYLLDADGEIDIVEPALTFDGDPIAELYLYDGVVRLKGVSWLGGFFHQQQDAETWTTNEYEEQFNANPR